MSNRRLLGERVAVRVAGCPSRDGVLISGVRKQTKLIQKFHVRFPNGDVRTHRGDQILLRGSKAPLTEFVRVGDIIFTKNTLGVVRFVGKHEEFQDWIIVLEPMDPKLPSEPNVGSFRKLFPSANLSDQNPYNILKKADDILKMLPPDSILQQISNIKDKYLAFVEERKQKEWQYGVELKNTDSRIRQLEHFQAQVKEKIKATEASGVRNGKNPGTATRERQNDPPEPHSVLLGFEPGLLGIKAVWATGEVESVSKDAQADHRGIQKGWKITHVDNEPYSEQVLDAHTTGVNPYTLTFEVPPDSKEVPTSDPSVENKVQPDVVLCFDDMQEFLGQHENPSGASPRPVLSDDVREASKQKIKELTLKIEESQVLVTKLKTKNTQLEEDHKEMTRQRVKAEHLRNSRVLFQSQIKTIQNRGKEWRKKAMEFEKKYQNLLEQRRRVEVKNNGHDAQTVPPGTGRAFSSQRQKNVEQDQKLAKGSGRSRRRKSTKMPMPEPGNTLSLKGLSGPSGPG